jgi:hypothetical protein
LILRLLAISILVTFSTLKAQTFHYGSSSAFFSSFLFNDEVRFAPADTEYVFSYGFAQGIMGAFYFDQGGYYSRKILGFKTEINFSRHNQIIKIYPTEDKPNTDRFYSYRTRLSFIDIPLMFSFCPSHHQGLTLELGPMLSFLQSASVKPLESIVLNPQIPMLSKSDFNPVSLSGVLGIGIFYSFTEKFALCATFRGAYGFGDIRKPPASTLSYNPTTRFFWGIAAQAVFKFNQYDTKRNKGYKYYLKHING